MNKFKLVNGMHKIKINNNQFKLKNNPKIKYQINYKRSKMNNKN
jgi:hypothetical protein